MAGREDLLAELPAKNPDEPSSLRQDIADELRDHLECAARRESLKNANPQTVEVRVLSRFGNPQKIACKLWFDAMKEILMTQKITLVLFSIVAFASLAACGLMWSLARDFQSASADAQAASAKLLSQGQETNAELLKQNQQMMQKLTALAERKDEPQAYLDWIPFKIEVVKADGKDTPAEGFTVGVRGKALAESEEIALTETTTEQGIADFGVVRPGYYQLNIDAPWGEKDARNILVKPGAPHVERIESPIAPPRQIEVNPSVKWPEELKGKNLAVLVHVSRTDLTKAGKSHWYGGGELNLLIRPGEGESMRDLFAIYADVDPGADVGSDQRQRGSYTIGLSNDYREGNLVLETVTFRGPTQSDHSTFMWPGRDAAISNLRLVKLPLDGKFPGEGETLKCIVSPRIVESFLRDPRFGSDGFSSGFPEMLAEFKAEGEGTQNWTIEIPEGTITIARAVLATEQFPNLSAGFVAMAARMFIALDKDDNQELSEAELELAKWPLRDAPKFPVALPAYVEAYIESRNSRTRRGGFSQD